MIDGEEDCFRLAVDSTACLKDAEDGRRLAPPLLVLGYFDQIHRLLARRHAEELLVDVVAKLQRRNEQRAVSLGIFLARLRARRLRSSHCFECELPAVCVESDVGVRV